MKKCLLAVLVMFAISSCNKHYDDDKTGGKKNCQLPPMSGNWIGKWGDLFDEPTRSYTFELKPNNVAIIDNSFATYTGEWHIEEYTFVASCIIEGETLQIKAPVSATKLIGTWKNITSNAYMGTFAVTKQ